MIAVISYASRASCWAVTGVWAPWCALAHALGWVHAEWLLDTSLRCLEPNHCRASAARYNLV